MSENPWILLLVFPLAAYVIGSTPFGVLIARARGVDLRKVGSGNVGATNVARAVGRRWGYLCFFLDMGKGLIPAAAGAALLGPAQGAPGVLVQGAWVGVGCGVILGHIFSFWLGFRGGKGVATALGVVLGVYPYLTFAGVGALGIWIAVTLITRYVSMGSIVAALAFLPLFAIFNHPVVRLWPLLGFAGVMVSLILIRHRTNIKRLLSGTENKIGRKST